nr:hypothetical protein [Xanthomonas phaseoli pv. phaseoli]MDM4807537.1 hypothetical protein [Xanthomonas phaseoli pv. phaseoli]
MPTITSRSSTRKTPTSLLAIIVTAALSGLAVQAQAGNPPAHYQTPEVEFSRPLSRGGSMKKSRFTDS